MASALIHGDRSQVLDQGSKTPIRRSSEAKKRLNSSDGTSSRQLASATKVPTAKSATKQRPSAILNPKTVDPVSKTIIVVESLLVYSSSFVEYEVIFDIA